MATKCVCYFSLFDPSKLLLCADVALKSPKLIYINIIKSPLVARRMRMNRMQRFFFFFFWFVNETIHACMDAQNDDSFVTFIWVRCYLQVLEQIPHDVVRTMFRSIKISPINDNRKKNDRRCGNVKWTKVTQDLTCRRFNFVSLKHFSFIYFDFDKTNITNFIKR